MQRQKINVQALSDDQLDEISKMADILAFEKYRVSLLHMPLITRALIPGTAISLYHNGAFTKMREIAVDYDIQGQDLRYIDDRLLGVDTIHSIPIIQMVSSMTQEDIKQKVIEARRGLLIEGVQRSIARQVSLMWKETTGRSGFPVQVVTQVARREFVVVLHNEEDEGWITIHGNFDYDSEGSVVILYADKILEKI